MCNADYQSFFQKKKDLIFSTFYNSYFSLCFSLFEMSEINISDLWLSFKLLQLTFICK